ncbi:hypothetical protein [Thermoproteus tenax]|uniref:Uncharacterized protein n=1 Tax=Thermoproteus tenax (strain ATCC 35583 / DSM 2078 / JCM 9277 / NBRC 100435 / Kra 1) TaxID=768679 RepID=G4RMZ4_THETK|nr:hypothetical protein [Thermoproteus tenax]CCC80938.1 hypothetical protein TTX_0262 [Thermoproteus tenax Kra 1]
MSVINPEDKARFGEDSTALLERNALRTAQRLRLQASVEERRIRLGGFEAEWDGAVARAAGREIPMDEASWRIFRAMLLSYFVNNGREPDERALEEALRAALGSD